MEPILNRLGPTLSDDRLRSLLTQPVCNIDLKEIITQRQILIVKVPRGQLGQNGCLLASLIVTGLQQAALSLSKEGTHGERRVALYLDEMENSIDKHTLKSITSQTSRYQLGLVAAIKTFQHLPEDFRNQLIISMGTLAVFALAKKDADILGPQMFRVDGRKIRHHKLSTFTDRMNIPLYSMHLITDEEKLNIDRVVGQEERNFFCYRIGTIAGVFQLRTLDFDVINLRNP